MGIKLNPYMLRKTFGSLMAEAGVQQFDLGKIMGHSNLQTTYQYYIDISHIKLAETMEKMRF